MYSEMNRSEMHCYQPLDQVKLMSGSVIFAIHAGRTFVQAIGLFFRACESPRGGRDHSLRGNCTMGSAMNPREWDTMTYYIRTPSSRRNLLSRIIRSSFIESCFMIFAGLVVGRRRPHAGGEKDGWKSPVSGAGPGIAAVVWRGRADWASARSGGTTCGCACG